MSEHRAAAPTPSAATVPSRARIVRFRAPERILHWVNATLFGILMATGAVLYLGPLETAIGHRGMVRVVHVVTGLLLPLPLLVARFGPARAGFRAEVAQLGRFDADDKKWLRSRGKDITVRMGKYHPGQKLNAAFTLGAIGVMFLTGSVMHWFRFFPVDWRTGATFTHDWFAVAIGVVVSGHLVMAVRDPDARRAMRLGWVTRAWARRHRPKWYADVVGEAEGPALEAQPAESSP